MKKRQYLESGQTLYLKVKNDSADFRRKFTIGERISEGAFAICYEAYHTGSGYGVLKEFYPEDAYVLERDCTGLLAPTEGLCSEQEIFLQEEESYLQPYEMLLDLKCKGDHEDLATFIPFFEIYQGCDKEGKRIGSVYIWTPEPKLETFEKICHDIHENPTTDPEKKLVLVLNAIKSLTECIRILHSYGIIHRDIKPSNFGFKKRGNEILYQTIALIDVNSICSVYSKKKDFIETKGYLEPEGRRMEVTNQTDIYAIGVTLFSAIVITDETQSQNYVYQSNEYDRIHELVKDSRLIRASEQNSHPRLVSVLTKILQKSLCQRSHRYENCEQLLVDLEEALFYALPTEIAMKQQAGQKWVLRDVEKSFNAEHEKNASMAIRYHLFEHPLYQCVKNDDPMIDVLIIGFGNYGQKFMDVCLQIGQIRNKGLQVGVLSDDSTDKDIYLTDRPVLPKFFNIDGSLDVELRQGALTNQDVYGNIFFETSQLKRDDPGENVRALKKIMDVYQAKNRQMNYIFIALGDDELNFMAANACQNAVRAYGWNCLVNYVCEKEKTYRGVSPEGNIYPLYINENVKELPAYPQIERMAFNTHLVWEKDLNTDFQVIRDNFFDPYNHDSSVSSVLSLKYKLHSVGIVLESDGYNTKAAAEFQSLILDAQNEDVRSELIWVEHRRWVTEKLCQGWQKKEIISCTDGRTKDEEKKQHICIVRSRPGQGLEKNWNHEKWDDVKNKEDLQNLDELDRMSVELHRFYEQKAKGRKKQGLLSEDSGILAEIRTLVEGNRPAVAAFQEWFACLKDIWDGEIQAAGLYEGLKHSLLQASSSFSEVKKRELRVQIDAFDLSFRPILESIRYRDWKQDDTALVDQIPFILTYDENLHMIIPYTKGNSTDIFKNVAAVTVVNPGKVTYLCYISGKADLNAITQSVPGVLAFMKKKKVRAQIQFLLLYEDNFGKENPKETFLDKTGCKPENILCISYADRQELSRELQTSFRQEANKDNSLLVAEKNNTEFSAYLDGACFYKEIPSYKFDDRMMSFTSLEGCDFLDYIYKRPYITVDEMLLLSRSYSEEHEQPEFCTDYKYFWSKYREDKEAWKTLCWELKKYADQNDLLVSIPIKDVKKEQKPTSYFFILPFACKKNVTMILEFLKEQKLVSGFGVQGYTSDSCKVSIHGQGGYKSWYDALFSHVTELMIPEAISVSKRGMEIWVEFDNMTVTQMSIDDVNETLQENIFSLATDLCEKGFLIHLRNEDGKLSFTYATRQVKELLTKEGKILEVYIYHKVKEQGAFDDVVSGYEFYWEQEGVKNECDCILTKGFQTLIVECKARPKIDQEFYYKLWTLASKIGVNAKAVLIADTDEPTEGVTAEYNAMQRRRGEGLGITTIWKEEEIDDIGETLLKILEI